MDDVILVTLRAENFVQDFELPANICLAELYPRLLTVLKKLKGDSFKTFSGIILEIQGEGMLNKTVSLADYGVCTGCYLDIAREEKYYGF